LANGIDENKLLIEKETWYEANRVKLETGKKVTKINPEQHEIILSDGNTDKYSSLLLATGASNRVLPIKGIDKEGIYTLRSLEDGQDILMQAEKSKRVLIIGGGILGIEIAWSLIKLKKEVVIVETMPRLIPRQLDGDSSQLLQKVVESHGVSVYTGTCVNEILGSEEVTGFITDNNVELPCDMVIHSTGICPNIELIKGAGIETNRGIIVNNKMQTSVPDVYAAGDVAEYEGEVLGLWNIASVQGDVAGKNIVGVTEVYEAPATPMVMNAFHYSLFSIGNIDDNESDLVIMDKPAGNKYGKVWFCKGIITGALILGSIKELPAIKRAMDRKLIFQEVYDKEYSVEDFLSLVKEKQTKKEPQLSISML
jgi:nitrite reductase (NADH) large subunit